MELWEAVGAEWDRALSGDVTTAFETASRLLDSRESPDDRAVLLAFRAFCELTSCDYLAGALTAEAAALESPTGELARFYVDAVRNGPGCLYTTTAHALPYHDYSTGFRCCADPTRAP